MTHEARQAARRPVDHEGAKESDAPGEPRAREVITPDWVALEDGTEVCEPGAITPPAPEKDPASKAPERRDPPERRPPAKDPPSGGKPRA